jgi:hypothetical protein
MMHLKAAKNFNRPVERPIHLRLERNTRAEFLNNNPGATVYVAL